MRCCRNEKLSSAIPPVDSGADGPRDDAGHGAHVTTDLRVRVRCSIVPPAELQREGAKEERSSKVFPFSTVAAEIEAAYVNEHVRKLLAMGSTLVFTIQEEQSDG